MKKLFSLVVTVALSAVLVEAGTARSADEKVKKTEVEGTWKFIKGGKGAPKKLEFSGNKFVLTFDADRICKGTFKINTEENPSWMDMTFVSSSTGKFDRKVAQCIYKFDGDGFTWCASLPGRKRRPQLFSETMGDARLFLGTYEKEGKE